MRQRRAAAEADLAKLKESEDGQLSRTDPAARLLAKHGEIVAGYNVQIAVDEKHKLIHACAGTASEVVNDGNDTGRLHAMAQAAKRALGAEDFCYEAAADRYRCPPGAELRPIRGHRRQASGKMARR